MNRIYFLTMVLLWVIAAAVIPVTQDEAYYFFWSQNLALGYFDHPPLVAIIGYFSRLSNSYLIARVGNIVAAATCAYLFIRILRNELPKAKQWQIQLGFLLCFSSIAGLFLGVLTTPDSGLMLAWVAAIHEAQIALRGDRKRWLSCGLATGIGLLSKYTMLLIGPVLLWGLVRSAPRQLRTLWPYLGGVLAFSIFALNLYWNYQNNWITFKFQTRHGVGAERSRLLESEFPTAKKTLTSLEEGYTKHFQSKAVLEGSVKVKKPPLTPLEKWLQPIKRMLAFLTSQIGLFGLTGVGMVFILFLLKLKKQAIITDPPSPLIMAGTVFPIGFFTFISLFSKVEPNWSAMALFSTAILIVMNLPYQYFRLLRNLALANVVIFSIMVLHAYSPILPIAIHKDRIVKETAGYPELAKFVSHIKTPIFAETYQITAMLNFYLSDRQIYQWEGLTRQSEFTRRLKFKDVCQMIDNRGADKITLITTNFPPPTFETLGLANLVQVKHCRDNKVEVLPWQEKESILNSCDGFIHSWYIVTYNFNFNENCSS